MSVFVNTVTISVTRTTGNKLIDCFVPAASDFKGSKVKLKE